MAIRAANMQQTYITGTGEAWRGNCEVCGKKRS